LLSPIGYNVAPIGPDRGNVGTSALSCDSRFRGAACISRHAPAPRLARNPDPPETPAGPREGSTPSCPASTAAASWIAETRAGSAACRNAPVPMQRQFGGLAHSRHGGRVGSLSVTIAKSPKRWPGPRRR